MSRTALYRHYAGHVLAYVGITENLGSRDKQHVATSSWHDTITRTETEWFKTRAEAIAAEKEAVRTERPLHNIIYSCDAPAKQFIDAAGAEHLAERLGVGVSAVRNARVKGLMPASWALIAAQISLQINEPCPVSAFRWKGDPASPDTPIADCLGLTA